eukprot:625736-Pyramimonas_sp.AAC.3
MQRLYPVGSNACMMNYIVHVFNDLRGSSRAEPGGDPYLYPLCRNIASGKCGGAAAARRPNEVTWLGFISTLEPQASASALGRRAKLYLMQVNTAASSESVSQVSDLEQRSWSYDANPAIIQSDTPCD